MAIDVWMQHPTQRFLSHDMFATLRRWTGEEVPDEEIPDRRRPPQGALRVAPGPPAVARIFEVSGTAAMFPPPPAAPGGPAPV